MIANGEGKYPGEYNVNKTETKKCSKKKEMGNHIKSCYNLNKDRDVVLEFVTTVCVPEID